MLPEHLSPCESTVKPPETARDRVLKYDLAEAEDKPLSPSNNNNSNRAASNTLNKLRRGLSTNNSNSR